MASREKKCVGINKKKEGTTPFRKHRTLRGTGSGADRTGRPARSRAGRGLSGVAPAVIPVPHNADGFSEREEGDQETWDRGEREVACVFFSFFFVLFRRGIVARSSFYIILGFEGYGLDSPGKLRGS